MYLKNACKLAIVISLLTTSGCEIMRVNKTADKVREDESRASGLVNSLRNEKQVSRQSVFFSNQQWVSKKPIDMSNRIPPLKDCPVMFVQKGKDDAMSLSDFAQWVTEKCGFQVYVTPDAFDRGESYRKDSKHAAPAGPAPITPALDSMQGLFPQTSGGSATSSFGSYTSMPYVKNVKYTGNLSGLLDVVAGGLGLTSKYDPVTERITISFMQTKTFRIWAFDFITNMNSTVKSGMSTTSGSTGSSGGGGGDQGSSGSESGSNSSVNIALKENDVITDISNTLDSMLSPIGRMSVSRSTGSVSVTDRPDVLERIGEYLASENRTLTTNVLLNVEVLSVSLKDKDQLALNMAALYKSLGSGFSFSLNNTFGGIDAAASSASVGILDTASSPWAGSNAIIQAIAQQGTISGYKAPSVRTLNLKPAPIQIGRLRGYIQSSTSTQTANVGSSASLNPGSITNGFNMTMLPKIIEGNSGEMLLRVTANMSSDPVFQTFTSKDGNSLIQTPDYDLQNIDQTVKLRSGQTLIMTGYDQTNDSATKQGTGHVSNFIFGGGAVRESTRDVIVFIITPIISD
ncbi:PilN family type IVB pilus formation outer membrane protein [Pseudomonas sp. DCB_CB]|uniref:PilN family type IVB pilus formation outer membrane protein n=1 Tax=unclassified Pseudomonas TaxID=196821 RepID=UPI002249084B|nr:MULTISPECIES: PilN family type IVB pilus formation outer membrane protein [unclassified Pseudomonas]MCX2694512.1 PilN family type IVB pilus formation outer membrane protein [Pseudomonas sp. DCB_BZ]MCX2859658.1 PilN family type IVB pilus formation outer membrane protein [Pseudomonas sp. DCB_CB]